MYIFWIDLVYSIHLGGKSIVCFTVQFKKILRCNWVLSLANQHFLKFSVNGFFSFNWFCKVGLILNAHLKETTGQGIIFR